VLAHLQVRILRGNAQEDVLDLAQRPTDSPDGPLTPADRRNSVPVRRAASGALAQDTTAGGGGSGGGGDGGGGGGDSSDSGGGGKLGLPEGRSEAGAAASKLSSSAPHTSSSRMMSKFSSRAGSFRRASWSHPAASDGKAGGGESQGDGSDALEWAVDKLESDGDVAEGASLWERERKREGGGGRGGEERRPCQ